MSCLARVALALGCGVGALALAGVSPAAAQARFSVPEGCGSEAEFARELERLTGQSPPPLPASLLIAPAADGGLALRLVVGDELRVLQDADCRVLWRSALVITAAARGNVPPAAEAPSPTTPPAVPPPASPAPAAPPASSVPSPAAPAARAEPGRAPASMQRASGATRAGSRPSAAGGARRGRASRAPARRTPRLATRVPRSTRRPPPAAARPEPRASPGSARVYAGASAGIGVSGGVLPGLGAMLELAGRVEISAWGFSASLRYWPERAQSRQNRGLEVWALGAQGVMLYRIAPALNLLAGIEVNRLEGSRTEPVAGGNSAAWQLAPNLGLTLITYDVEHLRLEIGAVGRVSLLRPTFLVTGFGDLYRAPLVGGDAILRGVWLF